MIFMPVMSFVFTVFAPAGLGLYWVCTGIFQIITQICINAYFKKVDVQDIIKANVEKANKKKEKKGIDVNKVASAATTSTKSIKSKANVNTKKVNSQDVKYKPGSMAAKANMVKTYEDKNRK